MFGLSNVHIIVILIFVFLIIALYIYESSHKQIPYKLDNKKYKIKKLNNKDVDIDVYDDYCINCSNEFLNKPGACSALEKSKDCLSDPMCNKYISYACSKCDDDNRRFTCNINKNIDIFNRKCESCANIFSSKEGACKRLIEVGPKCITDPECRGYIPIGCSECNNIDPVLTKCNKMYQPEDNHEQGDQFMPPRQDDQFMPPRQDDQFTPPIGDYFPSYPPGYKQL